MHSEDAVRIRSLGLRSAVVTLRMASLSLVAGALLSAATLLLGPSSTLQAEARLCTLVPGSTLALMRVEQDTTLPLAATGVAPTSSSGLRSGPGDSLLATALDRLIELQPGFLP